MMSNSRIEAIATIALCAICLVALAQDKARYEDTFDYIEKTGRLWGVASVTLNKDQSVTLVDAKSTGIGYALMMFDSRNKVVKSVTIKTGQSCTLSDGRHAFFTYELKSIDGQKLTFVVTDKFDARSFGDGIKKTTKTLTISPYKAKNTAG